MIWVIQSNLHREEGHARLMSALERAGSRFVEVQLSPFVDDLLAADVSLNGVNLSDVPRVNIDTAEPVFALGSYKLVRIASSLRWRPGAYRQNLDYPAWNKGWSGLTLNSGAWVGKLFRASTSTPVFVRPLSDSKKFTGSVFSAEEFLAWQDDVCKGSAFADVSGNTSVLLAPLRTIYSETRTWVVRGRVVTASLYRRGGQVFHCADVDDRIVEFAQACVDRWQPSPAFVLDIADTPDGPKVVEANCLSAAGFYAGDMQKLVAAIEGLLG